MRIVPIVTYVMAFVFIVGETSRRGFANATTTVEDYLSGALLLWVALSRSK